MIALDELLSATGGRVIGAAHACEFSGFAFDSRIVETGQIFLALVTETGDGHDHIPAACQAGAAGVLSQRPPPRAIPNVTYVLVDDTRQALLEYARYVLQLRGIDTIGITGSVGKSSTKEAVAAVLSTARFTFKTPGNYNGRLGLPIALGTLEPRHQAAVLELACDSFGEIRLLADLVRPRVGVVTSISASHLDVFGSLDSIADEKGQLIESLPAEGVAVLNYDDPRVLEMEKRTNARVLTFGLDPRADIRGTDVAVRRDGTSVLIHCKGRSILARIPYIGAHHAYTALAATAVGLSQGLSLAEIVGGLSRAEPLPGRTRLLPGIGGSWLLDDSYSANPRSSLAALETLRALDAERRIVVLGEMAHLGSYTEAGHRLVGERCAAAADVLLTKGELARTIAAEAMLSGMAPDAVHVAYTFDDVVRRLGGQLREGDLVLIKGDVEARMEHVTRQLLRDGATAPIQIARQNPGWARVRVQRPGRPTWVEIDLEAIANNVRRVVDTVGLATQVMAVLKADGYGHGAIKVARTAVNNGATWLGVACLGEAIDLRRAGIESPILALGYTPAWQSREAVLHRVTCTVFSEEVAAALSRAAEDVGSIARVHVKVDTGMGRIGLLPEDVLGFARAVASLPALEVQGLFTHFSDADGSDQAYSLWQLDHFKGVLAELGEHGLLPPLVHAANSAAIFRLPESWYSMVRLGIAMYGLDPSNHSPCPKGFRKALSFKCQVAQIKALPEGSYVSYGRTFRTSRTSRIAVIPVGYADGFRRAPQHWCDVLVRGQRAPIVGRVCMDQTMIDVTDIPGARQGDEVVLIGNQGDDAITVEEVAERLGTINYEVISEILARVPRIV